MRAGLISVLLRTQLSTRAEGYIIHTARLRTDLFLLVGHVHQIGPRFAWHPQGVLTIDCVIRAFAWLECWTLGFMESCDWDEMAKWMRQQLILGRYCSILGLVWIHYHGIMSAFIHGLQE